MGSGIVATLALIYAGFTALAVAAAVSIVRKAGYSGWWVCAGAIPLLNVVMLFAFAFADWPVLRDLRRAQSAPTASRHGGLSGPPVPTSEHPAFSYAAAAPLPPQVPHPMQSPEPETEAPAPAWHPQHPLQPQQPAAAADSRLPPRFPGYGPSDVLPGS